MTNVGQTVLLLIVGAILLRGAWTRTGYDAFLKGAGQGLRTAAALIPAITAMTVMLGVFTSSGLAAVLTELLTPLCMRLHLPPETVPLLILRPLTGSGSLTALQAVFEQCGVDSRAGRIASVLMGTSETIFYTLTVYLGATNVKRLPWVIPISLISYLSGALVTASLL